MSICPRPDCPGAGRASASVHSNPATVKESQDLASRLACLECQLVEMRRQQLAMLEAQMKSLQDNLFASESNAGGLAEKLRVAEEQLSVSDGNVCELREQLRSAEERLRHSDGNIADLSEERLILWEKLSISDGRVVELREKLAELSGGTRGTSTPRGYVSMETKKNTRLQRAFRLSSQEWAEKVLVLVTENPEGIYLGGFPDFWNERYPTIPIENAKPVQKLKSAIGYVEGVTINPNGLIQLRSDNSTTCRSRSRSPRWSSHQSATIFETMQDVMMQFLQCNQGQGPREEVNEHAWERKERLIRSFARHSTHFDPAKNPQAEVDWRHCLQCVPILSLKQTHDTVDDVFRNGRHAGEGVAALADNLVNGSVQPESITTMVGVRFRGDIWIVFGNRRLKAFKDAVRRGLRHIWISVIVHDLSEQYHSLFCKFLDAWSTDNNGSHAAFRSDTSTSVSAVLRASSFMRRPSDSATHTMFGEAPRVEAASKPRQSCGTSFAGSVSVIGAPRSKMAIGAPPVKW